MAGMLEKSARAIVHARHLFYNGEADVDFVWHGCGPDVQVCAIQEARAVLLAIREPDGSVCEEGWRASDGQISDGVAGMVFAGMIDAILARPSEGEG